MGDRGGPTAAGRGACQPCQPPLPALAAAWLSQGLQCVTLTPRTYTGTLAAPAPPPQGLSKSYVQLTQRPTRVIMGDASEGTFAYTWYAGRRAHRSYTGHWEACTKRCRQQQREAEEEAGSDAAEACQAGCYDEARAGTLQAGAGALRAAATRAGGRRHTRP